MNKLKGSEIRETIIFPPDLQERLVQCADEQDVSKSHVVREALKSYLRHYELGKLSASERYEDTSENSNEVPITREDLKVIRILAKLAKAYGQ